MLEDSPYHEDRDFDKTESTLYEDVRTKETTFLATSFSKICLNINKKKTTNKQLKSTLPEDDVAVIMGNLVLIF